MINKNNLGKLKERIFVTRALKGSIIALGVFILGFILAPALIAEADAVQHVYGNVDWESVSLTLDPDVAATEAYDQSGGSSGSSIEDPTHGDMEFGDITPSSSSSGNLGTLKVLKKTIGVTTSGKYYTVYLSVNDTSNGLNLVTTENGQTVTHSEYKIPAIGNGGDTITWSNPANFNGVAGWGYAVPGVENKDIPGAPSTFIGNLLTDTQIYASSSETGAQRTYTQSTWAPVATKEIPQQIWKNETDALTGFENGDTFDVYYGILINTDILAGTYQNNIIYTALASTNAIDSVSSNIFADKSFGGKGDEVKIRFDLVDSTSSVTRQMVHVAMVPHSVMATTTHYNGGA